MSITSYNIPGTGTPEQPSVELGTANRPLHRLAAVRRQQGVSRRTVARRLDSDIGTVRLQEHERCDLPLTTLYAWQEILEVPIAELLIDSNDPLSPPVLKRAQMLRLMKTALAILEQARQPSIRRMAQVMVNQLLEIMPELEGVSPWHAVGKRRTLDELGQAAQRQVSADLLRDTHE